MCRNDDNELTDDEMPSAEYHPPSLLGEVIWTSVLMTMIALPIFLLAALW